MNQLFSSDCLNRSLALAIGVALLIGTPVLAQDHLGRQKVPVEIVIQTRSGQLHSGVADSRSSHVALWLRRDADGISLARSYPWSRIESAWIDGRATEINELAREVRSLSTRYVPSEHPVANFDDYYASSRTVVAASHVVASLQVRACLANWDTDREADGIEIEVIPVDRRGNLVPTRGTLSVRLLGSRQTSRHRESYGELKRWSERVSADDFANQQANHQGDWLAPARYRLPFRGLDSEDGLAIHPEAAVIVRLGVPGQGSFEASAPVILRYYDPLRNHPTSTTRQPQRFRHEVLRGRSAPAAVRGSTLIRPVPTGLGPAFGGQG